MIVVRWWWRLIRFGFRLLYNEMAFTYDLVSKAVSMGQWRCWQRAALKHLKPGTQSLILELAHGTGDLQLDLASAGYRSIGYDLSPYMGRIASRKLQRHGVKARLVRGLAQGLPFADESVDAIVCTFPTDFIFAESTLHEAWRVLRPEGRLVIVINGVFTGRGLMTRLLEGLYWITGQRPAHSEQPNPTCQSGLAPGQEAFNRVMGVFRSCDFEAELKREPCQGSYAQVIVADKITAR
ncbi:MAG TPA: methyltransferase domain-containing protein [Phototrophicaceae bacterium]|jgi:SAM-dependent methyltransferase|nr:methyltransferase domain-containing protein [Phototrophicaceae bacterium]